MLMCQRASGQQPAGEAHDKSILHDIKWIGDSLQLERKMGGERRCLEFCIEQAVFPTLAIIAVKGTAEQRRAVLGLFRATVEDESDEFLAQGSLRDSISSLLFHIQTSGDAVAYQHEIVQLLFTIAQKIRVDPALLNLWFVDTRNRSAGSAGKLDERAQNFKRHDFLIFYYLLDYVYRRGETADYARMALLHIVEASSHSLQIEAWVSESELPSLMASVLSALYSQLTTALDQQGPELQLFLSYMEFFQDVMDCCRSRELIRALLANFHKAFLAQVLFPSLVVASSSEPELMVASQEHLRMFVAALQSEALCDLSFRYMLGMATPFTDKPELAADPSLFSVTDLLRMYLSHEDTSVVAAAARLLACMLQKCPFLGARCFRVDKSKMAGLVTLDQHRKDVRLIADLSPPVQDLEAYFHDILRLVSQSKLPVLVVEGEKEDALEQVYLMYQRDPILCSLVTHVSRFFTNSVILNMALTEAITAMVMIPPIALERWLMPVDKVSEVPELLRVLQSLAHSGTEAGSGSSSIHGIVFKVIVSFLLL